MNSLQEFWEHLQLQARQRWRDVESPIGLVRALLPPYHHAERQAAHGPHSGGGRAHCSILRALVYSEEQIVQLRTEIVI